MVCIICFDLWRIMRSLKSTKRPASRFLKWLDSRKNLKYHKSNFQSLICNAPSKQIQADSLQWVTSHPGQHVVNQSIHFIGIPKRIRLWEVQSKCAYVCYDERRSPKISQKILYSAHLFLECFWLMDGLYLLRSKWVSFLVEKLLCATCNVGMSTCLFFVLLWHH